MSEHAAGYEIERRVGWTSFERPSPRSNMYFFHSLVLLSIMGAEVIIDGRGRGGGEEEARCNTNGNNSCSRRKNCVNNFWAMWQPTGS